MEAGGKANPTRECCRGYEGRSALKLLSIQRLGHEQHPLPRAIIDYRGLSKLKSTYLDPLPTYVGTDGRLHTTFHQAATATGRLSSSDPNLQNIPIRGEMGPEIRRAFVAGEGKQLISADYSQVELRLLAHVAGDPGLIEAFERDEDVHRRTAAEVHGIAPEAVSADQRAHAKAINFGIIYGSSAFGIANQLGIAQAEAQATIDRYFERYRGVRRFLDETVEHARTQGFVRTLLGRRRPVPELRSDNGRIRAQAENVAVNTPIQGSAADLMKVAMVRLHRRLREEGLQAQLLLQVHDELLLETPGDELERAARVVREEMEGAIRLDVPLKVDLFQGPNWCDLEELDAPRG